MSHCEQLISVLTQDDVRGGAGKDEDRQKCQRDNEHVKITIIPLSHTVAHLRMRLKC